MVELKITYCVWYNKKMRIDKYLKVSRILKRRSIACEACSLNRVKVNGVSAKPGKQIKVGDLLTLRFGTKDVTFKVLVVPEGNVIKGNIEDLYQVLEDDSIKKQ